MNTYRFPDCGLSTADVELASSSTEDTEPTTGDIAGDSTDVAAGDQLVVGTYVVAVYDGYHYVGKIICVDDDDITINFMTCTNTKLNRFKWPRVQDQIPVPRQDVVAQIADPVAFSSRVFTVDVPDGLNLGQ